MPRFSGSPTINGVPRFVGRPQFKAVLAPYPSEAMTCWPVSARVGNVKNSDPSDGGTVKDAFADFCAALNFAHGNVHMTFASLMADHSRDEAPSKRLVSARMVMPITGAIEFRDWLTQLIDALTAQGAIIPEIPLPTIVMPPGRPSEKLCRPGGGV